jgi:Ser/Thr protein kinase RdoA (MazF antagonist)
MNGESERQAASVPEGLRARLASLFPGARIVATRTLRPDASPSGSVSEKGIGYGKPIRVGLELADGARRDVVFHTASPDDFGHDRRADRADAMLLAYDSFAQIPRHVEALDVGAIRSDGALVPLVDTREFYLITGWVDGTLYADDLRRIAATGIATKLDVARVDALAHYLADLHRAAGSHEGAYTRSIRDLVGGGEGIAGMVDGYPPDTPGAPIERLHTIEQLCLEWRFRLRGRVERLRRTHGDFHPFNLLFGDQTDLVVLDTSRGSEGDPADDVAALTINYLFFGLGQRGHWQSGLGTLWERFFTVYSREAREVDVLDAIAPFFAWRALVIASPRWYPNLSPDERGRILAFAERALRAKRFDPASAVEAVR